MQKTPVLLTLCAKDTPSCELNLCVPHIWQTFLHNDKLEQKFFRMLIKVAWTKKRYHLVLLCVHMRRHILVAKFSRETRRAVQGRDIQSLGMEKLSAKTSPDALIPWWLLGENKSGVKIPYAIFSKCTTKLTVAFILYPISFATTSLQSLWEIKHHLLKSPQGQTCKHRD